MLADRIRLRQLKLILAPGEQGTLRRASTAINVTQPTATKMLADLEQITGMALYERRPRGLLATPHGREGLAFATEIMAEFDRLLVSLDALSRGSAGELVAGAILGATPDVIVRAVLELKQAQPLLTIKLRDEASDHVLAPLESRAIDIAVGRFNDASQHNHYSYEPLGDEALCVVGRTRHPLAGKCRLRLVDLAGQRWIMQSIATPARQIREVEFGKSGVSTPADIIEANSILTMIQLAD